VEILLFLFLFIAYNTSAVAVVVHIVACVSPSEILFLLLPMLLTTNSIVLTNSMVLTKSMASIT
jgi:hypothetical protein